MSTQQVSHQDTHSFELLPAHIHALTSRSWYTWLLLLLLSVLSLYLKRAIHTVAQFDISVAREKFWVAPFVAWGVAEKGGMA